MSSTSMAAHRIRSSALRALTWQIFKAAGTADDIADTVAASLVLSNECGVDSHGCIRIPEYLDGIQRGRIDPVARPNVVRDGATIRVEGDHSFGQFAAREMTVAAVEATHKFGLAAATLSGVQHIGRLGEFVELAAANDCIAFLACNGGPPGGMVAPFGGSRRALATNPIAFALPAGRRPMIVADFSTSVAAEGKIRVYRHAGRQLPDGWVIDSEGNPTTQPGDLYAGGAILPAGGHKGFALGLLVEILGGVLAGEGCASIGDDPGNGAVMLTMDISRFSPRDVFGAKVDQVIDALEAIPPAPGYESVVVPGMPEAHARTSRARDGIPFPAETWRSIIEAARAVGLDVDEASLNSAGGLT